MKPILFGAVALAIVTAACGGGNSHSDTHMGASTSTSSGTAAGAARTIDVTMVDIGYQPAALTVQRGERVDFVFHNQGKIPHDAFIGDEAAQTEHEKDMNGGAGGDMSNGRHGQGGITVQPGTTGSLTYTFDKPGPVEIGCHQPGHYAAGMKLTVAVA